MGRPTYSSHGSSMDSSPLSSSSPRPTFVPVPLSNGYYLPENYRSLYFRRTETDQLEIRRQTFTFWPSWAPGTLNTDEMARLGLYYTGEGDKVKCSRCSFTFEDWQDGDDPNIIHQNNSPRCRRFSENNIIDRDSGEGEDFVDFGGTGTSRPTSEATQNVTQCGADWSSWRSNGCNSDASGTGSAYGMVPKNCDSADSDCDSAQSDCESSGHLVVDASVLASKDGRKRNDLETFRISRTSQSVSRYEGELGKTKRPPQTNGSLRRFTTNTKQRLKEENEKLRKAMTCRRCNAENSQTLFLPCRHLVTCEQCAEEIDDCVLCQTKILGTVRIFMT